MFFSHCPASFSHYPHSQQENKFVRFGGKYQECRESVNILPNLFYFLSFLTHFSGESGDLIRPRTATALHKLTVYMHTCIIMGPSGLPSGSRKPSCLLPSAELLCNATLLLPCFCQPEFGHLSTHCITKIKSRRETEAALQHKCHADSTSYRTVLFTCKDRVIFLLNFSFSSSSFILGQVSWCCSPPALVPLQVIPPSKKAKPREKPRSPQSCSSHPSRCYLKLRLCDNATKCWSTLFDSGIFYRKTHSCRNRLGIRLIVVMCFFIFKILKWLVSTVLLHSQSNKIFFIAGRKHTASALLRHPGFFKCL